MFKKTERSRRQPRARAEALVIRQTGEELLVYDLERHRAHCLNRAAALVWAECDGVRTLEEIAERAGVEINAQVDREWVSFALKQLEDSNLLAEQYGFSQELAGISRREVVRRLGWGTLAALPLVSSILVPTAQAAASCLAPGAACTTSVQCCTGLCNVNVCA